MVNLVPGPGDKFWHTDDIKTLAQRRREEVEKIQKLLDNIPEIHALTHAQAVAVLNQGHPYPVTTEDTVPDHPCLDVDRDRILNWDVTAETNGKRPSGAMTGVLD